MQVIHKLSDSRTLELIEYINSSILPLAQAEQSKCALGRLNLWLNAEPNYSNKTYMPAHTDERLWTYLKRLFPDGDLAQIYFGNRGIDWHRDAAYASTNACILNLGACTLESESRGGVITSLDLTGGELIHFDCKLKHRCINPDASRIGIGIWNAKIPLPMP